MMAKKRAMIICAHPDDEILGAGGTIAKYTKEGIDVIAVIFSYGEKSHWWMEKKYTVERRVKESKKAGELVGTKKTVFLGLKDLDLKTEVNKKSTIDLIEKIILKYKPFRIFTHSPDDIVFPDHRAVYDAVIATLDKSSYTCDVFAFNIWGKDVRTSQNLRLLIDISDTFDLKRMALKSFSSQWMYIFQLLPGVYWRAFRHGFENSCRFAEKFIKVR